MEKNGFFEDQNGLSQRLPNLGITKNNLIGITLFIIVKILGWSYDKIFHLPGQGGGFRYFGYFFGYFFLDTLPKFGVIVSKVSKTPVLDTLDTLPVKYSL